MEAPEAGLYPALGTLDPVPETALPGSAATPAGPSRVGKCPMDLTPVAVDKCLYAVQTDSSSSHCQDAEALTCMCRGPLPPSISRAAAASADAKES